MGKGIYLGVGGKARKVKKMYVGVENQARKVKKAYIGVGGVARPCFSSGGVEYYGTITPLPKAVNNPIGLSFDGKSFFADYSALYMYDQNLVLSTPVTLDGRITATNNNSYILIHRSSNSVMAIDKNMTKNYSVSFLTKSISDSSSGKIGQYALIGYGDAGDYYNPNPNSTVDAYSDVLVKTTIQSAGDSAIYRKAAWNEKYCLFGSGSREYGNMSTNPVAFDANLTYRSCASDWSRLQYGCASTDNHVMFGGGYQQGGNYIPISYVSAYDNSLTKSTPMELSDKKRLLTGLSTPNYAMFAGGDTMGTPEESVNVDVYGLDLVRESPALSLSQGRWSAGAAMTGNYAIFAGGNDSNNRGTTVADAYLIND